MLFTVRDLLIATTLISLGAGMLVLANVLRRMDLSDTGRLAIGLFLYGGYGLIGAGVLAPFQRPWLGFAVVVGLIFLLALLLLPTVH